MFVNIRRVHKGECKRPDLEITYHSTRKEKAIDAANIEEDEEEDDDDIVTTNFSLHPAELGTGCFFSSMATW